MMKIKEFLFTKPPKLSTAEWRWLICVLVPIVCGSLAIGSELGPYWDSFFGFK